MTTATDQPRTPDGKFGPTFKGEPTLSGTGRGPSTYGGSWFQSDAPDPAAPNQVGERVHDLLPSLVSATWQDMEGAYNDLVGPEDLRAVAKRLPNLDAGEVAEVTRRLAWASAMYEWLSEPGIDAIDQVDHHDFERPDAPKWALTTLDDAERDWYRWQEENAEAWREEADTIWREAVSANARASAEVAPQVDARSA